MLLRPASVLDQKKIRRAGDASAHLSGLNFRLPAYQSPGGASTYSRSVLGAGGNLEAFGRARRGLVETDLRYLRKVYFSTFSTAVHHPCGNVCGTRLASRRICEAPPASG